MDIEVAQRYLGEVDVDALCSSILAQEPAAWEEQLLRQQDYEVHRDTESIVLLFCEESWPEGEIYKEAGWDRLADVAIPVVDHIINSHYVPGGTILRIMDRRVPAPAADTSSKHRPGVLW